MLTGSLLQKDRRLFQELLQSDHFTLKHCFATENWIASGANVITGKGTIPGQDK